MNKLSALVIGIFLMLAAAMWYSANASFEQYIKHEVTVIGNNVKDFDVITADVKQLGDTTFVTTMTIYNNETTLVTLSNIIIKINNKSLEEDIFIIDSVNIEQVKLSLDKQKRITLIKNLTQYVAQQQKNTKSLPSLTVKAFTIGDDSQHNNIPLDISLTDKGLRADLLFIEMIKLLISE